MAKRVTVKEMLWTAVAIAFGLWMFWGGLRTVYRAYYHHGGGNVAVYVGSGHSREAVDEVWVNESRYKRERYVDAAVGFIAGGYSLYFAFAYWTDWRYRDDKKGEW